jgi:hypothetical protein
LAPRALGPTHPIIAVPIPTDVSPGPYDLRVVDDPNGVGSTRTLSIDVI